MNTGLLQGLIDAFQPITFLMMLIGTVGGIIIGAIPGMSGSMGVILLLPLVYQLDKVPAMVVLAAMFCGSMYGGSISAILLKTPGTPSASATVLDGYPMGQKGQAGKALFIAVFASTIGGFLSGICLLFIAPQLAKVALNFQAPEFFALSIFGLTLMAGSSGKSMVKGLMSGFMGLFLSTVGVDIISGNLRFTFGVVKLMAGFNILPVLIGVFALAQVFVDLSNKNPQIKQDTSRLGNMLPSREEFRSMLLPILIGSVIGIVIGIIPGSGGAISCFLAYEVTRRISKHPDLFGTGIVEGIAAPESSNNGTTGGALVPLLTLGIPGDTVTAVMLGAFMLIGIKPGPQLFVENGQAVNTFFMAFIIMQFLMLFFGIVGTKVWPKLLDVPRCVMMPLVMIFCFLGAYTLNNNLGDVVIALIFGIIGFFMQKLGFPGAPMILGIILGPMAEQNLNRALLISHNDWKVFFARPISCTFIIVTVLSIIYTVYSSARKKAGKE
ncbi:MAG: tripartite tricarboxylate transporter permease [Treponema sp.]|jgi:putative tricarboxylic transport membrane protein|nr:tripartite tricarboxylate transporter permease [Treponema sp.]